MRYEMKTQIVLFYLFICTLVFAFISCDYSKEGKQEKNVSTKSSNPEDALKETNRQIEKAIYESDYETLLKFYTDDAVCAGNFQPTLKGKNAIKESYLKQQKEGTKFHSFKTKTEKLWECDKNIYEYGTYGLSVSSNETKHPYAFTGSYFMIWEKQKDESYLIKYLISNLDFNPCKDYY